MDDSRCPYCGCDEIHTNTFETCAQCGRFTSWAHDLDTSVAYTTDPPLFRCNRCGSKVTMAAKGYGCTPIENDAHRGAQEASEEGPGEGVESPL